jgi:hypothetical protein
MRLRASGIKPWGRLQDNPCHSERSEESLSLQRVLRIQGFLVALGMTNPYFTKQAWQNDKGKFWNRIYRSFSPADLLCWINDLFCVYAGHRDGERPRGCVFPVLKPWGRLEDNPCHSERSEESLSLQRVLRIQGFLPFAKNAQGRNDKPLLYEASLAETLPQFLSHRLPLAIEI